ncbi:glycosyltransferase family 2 protein [Achromobacter anxifer]|uniref:glycosyltransferase family 2 protein n=1 Tax=Achromobacter anxifer TaxID=1287737 RepID=UPI00215752DA|nr:glycosyltransferase [Achromobacter anxifer]
MKLSVVATLYRSAPYIREFHQRASAAAQALTDNYEIVLVNDGSPDESLEIAEALVAEDPKVVVVDLSRNFGHHKAIMTGLTHARGERVFLIDVDLEESPEWLEIFDQVMREEDADVVYGVQARRKGGLFERWSGMLYYKVLRLLTGFTLPENLITARLMTRRYVDALLQFREREVFLAGLWHITGFRQVARVVTKLSTSPTSYTFRQKLSLLVNSVTSVSNRPLIFIFYVGALISIVALIYASYLVTNWLLFSNPPSGWTSVMISIWLMGGLVISFIGIIGIYLSKIFTETKQRPYTIVRKIHGRTESRHIAE